MLLFLMFAFSVIRDCADVVNLAVGLNMNAHDPVYFSILQDDCCVADGISCTTVVYQINWSVFGEYTHLDGTINATAIPPYLRYLDLSHNDIVGSFPVISSIHMKNLYFSVNNLNGTIPTTLPPNLEVLAVTHNNLRGNVPEFPSSLTHLYLEFISDPSEVKNKNHFSGVLKLNAPETLFINDNWITDIIVADASKLTHNLCDISNNPLLNNPNIAKLAICIQNDLYDARLLSDTVIAFETTHETHTTLTDHLKTMTGTMTGIDAINESGNPLVQTKITTDNPVATLRKRLSNSATRELQMSTTTAATSSVKTEKVSMPTAFTDVRSTIRLDFTRYSVTQYIFLVLKVVVGIALIYFTLLTAPLKREWDNRSTSKVSGKSFL